MNKAEWKKWVGVAGRLLLGYALILSQCALAGQNPKTTDKANSLQQTAAPQPGEKQSSAATAKAQSQEVKGEASESAVAEEKPSSDASHQGIKVHGHWTIEVRNPDGTLVTHREFENSLGSGGGIVLAKCLVKGCNITQWQITIDGAGGCTPTCAINAIPTIPTSGPNTGLFVLSASQPLAAATLQQVSTVAVGVLDGVPGASFQITSTTISPISVVNGQIVQATVVISFS
jgi:hypothetical protein